MIGQDLIEQNRQKLVAQRVSCEARIVELTASDPFNLEVSADHDDERTSADDEAQLNEQHERVTTQIDAQKKMIIKIDNTLERIKDGSYGVCEDCGKDIEDTRIKAMPLAALCLADEKIHEDKAKKRL